MPIKINWAISIPILKKNKLLMTFWSTDSSFKGEVYSSKKNNSLSEDVFNLCKDKGLLLQELKIEEGRLDDVFREITVADTKIDKESKAGKEEE